MSALSFPARGYGGRQASQPKDSGRKTKSCPRRGGASCSATTKKEGKYRYPGNS